MTEPASARMLVLSFPMFGKICIGSSNGWNPVFQRVEKHEIHHGLVHGLEIY
jgi:hypothetical protein